MTISTSDLNSTFIFRHQSIYVSIGIICILIFVLVGWLKITYGTFSFGAASKKWKENAEIRRRYEDLFNTRNNLMYHISWSKSRGEKDQARQLMKELDKVDKEIDEIEMSNFKYLVKRKVNDRNPSRFDEAVQEICEYEYCDRLLILIPNKTKILLECTI